MAAGRAGEDAAMAQFMSYDGTKLAFRRAWAISAGSAAPGS
jgi:hypothetical protein